MKQDELRMTYSGLLLKGDEKIVRVCFERGKSDIAEGTVPRGTIEKSNGFSQEELEQLSYYLRENAHDIMKQAKEVNFLKSWLKKD